MTDDARHERRLGQPTYWLPSWWSWIEDWSRCRACLEYNHAPCVSCEIPPGMLGLACLVGGGTVAVAGSLRGNQTLATETQAHAAARMDPLEAAHPNPPAAVESIQSKQESLIEGELDRELLKRALQEKLRDQR